MPGPSCPAVLDEVYRVPNLFGVLRGVIDDNRANGFRTGQLLLLGSASLELTKSPKIYVRDTGLLRSLLEIGTMHDLRGHPSIGASFESLCIEALIDAAPANLRPYFFRTATGDEIDLVLVQAERPVIAIEAKLSTAPTLSPGFHRACDALGIPDRWLVTPDGGTAGYRLGGVEVVGLAQLVTRLRES